MRTIEEMTHEEILKLTEEDLEMMYKYECARQGIKFLDKPIEPDRPAVDFDAEVFSLGSFYSQDKELLQKLFDLISENSSKLKHLDYDYTIGSEYKYLSPARSYDIEQYNKIIPTKCLSAHRYEELKNKLECYGKLKKHYDADFNEWNKHDKERRNLHDYLWNIYYEHAEEERVFNRHKERFNGYIELAKGDFNQAKDFYLKAYSLDEKMQDRLFNKGEMK